MKIWFTAVATLAVFVCASAANAQAVRIGVLTDRNGMVYDVSGDGSAVAARLAVQDFALTVLNCPIEVLAGDH